MWKLFFVLFLSGCCAPIVENKINNDALNLCKNACNDNYHLTYKNEKSYSCTCLRRNINQ